MTWRDELRQWRKTSGKIQKEAADSIGVPVETFRGWECEGKKRQRTPPEYVQNLIREKMYGNRTKA